MQGHAHNGGCWNTKGQYPYSLNIIQNGQQGRPPCTTAGKSRWTGVAITMSLVTVYDVFVDPATSLQREFKDTIAQISNVQPRAVKIHRIDPLDVGVRVSVSVRVDVCGESCKADADRIAANLEVNRQVYVASSKSHHPLHAVRH
mmetsp:Transcript_5275/g.8483  ORF Transcript_5275/g.8483 Transcript_5275/m.8483 type:complete len:145 (-) Transcript_5275:139-573(-)